MGIDAVISANC